MSVRETEKERVSNQDQKLHFENLDVDHSLSLSFHKSLLENVANLQ